MRFTITPLGSAGGRSVGQVVDDIVRYLDGPPPPAAAAPGRTAAGETGPSRYYADASAEPGRWLGNGAAEMTLSGSVESRDFARVLAGRDPNTGLRLITARGSAGRRPTLARGTQTCWDTDGEPLYDMRDAAAALKLEVAEVERMIAAGEALAVRAACALLGSEVPQTAQFGGAYLAPVIDKEGARWISEQELQRCEGCRGAGPDPDAVAAAGGPEDILTLAEAARMAGVSARYLRTLCKKWEGKRERIEAAWAAGDEPPRPFLRAYRGLKGQWLVKRPDLVEYLRHRTAPAVRVGYDLTLTTEKSLGVLALLGDEHTRDAVLGAIQDGNDRGLRHLEYAAAMARANGEPVSSRGWTVASFRHFTSRALDPFPHHHNVVANTVVDPDGTRRALDARWLYRHAGEASALATAEMRHRLTTELGVGWRRGRKGGWEVDGIPYPVLLEFSRRSSEVDDAVAELEALIGRTATIGELRGLVTRTRPAKRQAEATDLVAEWWDRAQALGFERRDLKRCLRRLTALPAGPTNEVIFDRLAAPDGLCTGTSVFTRGDVIAALVDLGMADTSGREQPVLLTADDVERIADEFLASDHVVELLADEQRSIAELADQPLFTTTEMLTVQARILEAFRAGRAAGVATVPDGVLAQTLERDRLLSTEQRFLVAAFCTSGDRVQCAVGRAGAGKTTAMRAAVEAWRAAGYRVLGAAVKGEAARHLGHEAGIESETLAWHLAHTDPQSGPLDARTVLIVDESSTVSDRDLARLLWLCQTTGAALRLIGDPAQHGAVGAGGMFGVLCADPGASTPELRTSHRVADPRDRAAADALREGRISEALAALEAAGHLHVVSDEVDLYLDLLQRWWSARQDGDEHPMVDRRNRTRWQLNRLAHRLLQVTGDVGREEVLAARERRFSVGDRVVARIGDRGLYPPGRPADYVRNGATGTVLALRKHRNDTRDRIVVAFDRLGSIELPRSFFDEHTGQRGRMEVGLDHAYAVTSYAVQGSTFAESTSRIDENASRSETYVDITRGRSANHLYLTRSLDPLDGEHLPKSPAPPIEVAVGSRLAGSGPERAAIDVDPAAPSALSSAMHESFPSEPDPTVTDGTAAVAAAVERRRRRAERFGGRRLDSAVVAHLCPRSHVPFLARQWDETAAGLHAFLERWNVTPGGSERWEWALGTRRQDAVMDAERRRLEFRVVDLVFATIKDAMGTEGVEMPAWARSHLAHHVALGECVHDADRLRELYRRIEGYRADAGIDVVEHSSNVSEAIFGPPPDDAALRMRRLALLNEAMRTGSAMAREAAGRVSA